MSAYLVSRGHIRYLVEAALRLGGRRDSIRSYYHGTTRHEVNELTAGALGLMLWTECLKSVSARYPDDAPHDLPGPTNDGPRLGYVHVPMLRDSIVPIAVLKAIKCYEYQSCEHAEWEQSQAAAFCTALRLHAIACLPGYDDAPWGCPDGWELPPPAPPARPRLVPPLPLETVLDRARR